MKQKKPFMWVYNKTLQHIEKELEESKTLEKVGGRETSHPCFPKNNCEAEETLSLHSKQN